MFFQDLQNKWCGLRVLFAAGTIGREDLQGLRRAPIESLIAPAGAGEAVKELPQ